MLDIFNEKSLSEAWWNDHIVWWEFNFEDMITLFRNWIE